LRAIHAFKNEELTVEFLMQLLDSRGDDYVFACQGIESPEFVSDIARDVTRLGYVVTTGITLPLSLLLPCKNHRTRNTVTQLVTATHSQTRLPP
jgi:hypothetical protein